MRAVVGDRPVPRPDVAQDPDVLARARERLGERLAVPALDDLRAGHAEPEDQAAARQMVERHRRHRGRRRRSGRDLHDRGPELDPLGRASPTTRAASARPSRTPRRSRSSQSRAASASRTASAAPGGRAAGPVAGVQSEPQFARHRREPYWPPPRTLRSRAATAGRSGLGLAATRLRLVGSRPALRAASTHSVWAWRRRVESPSGAISMCSLSEGR